MCRSEGIDFSSCLNESSRRNEVANQSHPRAETSGSVGLRAIDPPVRTARNASVVLNMVRDTGFEPVTPSVSRRCSTTELTALISVLASNRRRAGRKPYAAPLGQASLFGGTLGNADRGVTPCQVGCSSVHPSPFSSAAHRRDGWRRPGRNLHRPARHPPPRGVEERWRSPRTPPGHRLRSPAGRWGVA